MMATTPQHLLWQTLAKALQEKKGVAGALEQAKAALAGDPLADVVAALARQVQAGQRLSQALRHCPDAFDPKIVAAVEAGEEAANLGEVAAQIADAVEQGDAGKITEAQQSSAEAARVFEQIMAEALRSRATDVHIEPLEGGRTRVRQRIDGVLHDMRVLPEGSAGPLAMRVKAMASMDITQRRMPQDGRIAEKRNGRELALRISTLPIYCGERIIVRILRREEIRLGLEKLGLTDENLATVRRFCKLPQGIVIVNGPAGSGKTTLLYSMLMAMDSEHEAIFTVEDPVEYLFDRINQTEIAPEIGLTFSRLIRQFMRHSPDVIMIGEIRDREVLELASQVAMTGHLVLSTLHANTSPAAVQRFVDLGLPAFLVNASLTGVISLRLARTLCPQCKQQARPDPTTLPPEAQQILQRHENATWHAAKGCPSCTQTGYAGQVALHEILVMNDAIRQLVSEGSPISQVRKVAVQGGMKTMLEDGLAKAAQGVTSIEEVLRIVPQEAYH